MEIYEILFREFGSQLWWPGDTPFEIMVGAILTQNTNWKNVEKAIKNLKTAGVLEPHKLHKLPLPMLAELIKPAGYFNIKAGRLKNFMTWFCEKHGGSLKALEKISTQTLREELLAIKGIGPETADSILLYALGRPVFVVDTYTARLAIRHGLIDESSCNYDELQELFTGALERDVKLFNEYHALIVRLGKDFCRPKPLCAKCPLNHLPHRIEERGDQ